MECKKYFDRKSVLTFVGKRNRFVHIYHVSTTIRWQVHTNSCIAAHQMISYEEDMTHIIWWEQPTILFV